jgi:hypothetical protein
MSPQAPTATPAQPVVPMANQVNPQGVSTPPVTTAPTPSALPTAPQITPLSTTPAPQQTNLLPSQLENIANYYSIPRQTAAMVNAAQAQGANAQQATKYSTAQAGYTADMAQKQLDPSTYTVTNNPNPSNAPGGGLNIVNSLGEPVSLATYVNLTGANPAEVLAKSNSPQDQQFVADYTNLQNYIQTKQAADNGSVQAQAELGDYYDANPGLQNVELGQLSSAFMQSYGQYFGQPQGNANALQQAIGSNNIQSVANPVTTSAYENPNYQTQFQSNPYQSNASGSVASQLAALTSQSGT